MSKILEGQGLAPQVLLVCDKVRFRSKDHLKMETVDCDGLILTTDKLYVLHDKAYIHEVKC